MRARWLALLAASCAPPLAAPIVASPSAAPASRGDWGFVVDVGPGARELRVEASLSAGSGESLVVDDCMAPYVSDVEVQRGELWQPVRPEGSAWPLPACREGCRLRYRFRLDEAARSLEDVERASRVGETLFAPPSTWLLRPAKQPTVGRWRLQVRSPAPEQFVTGLATVADGYEAETSDLPESPYTGFGPFRRRSLRVAGGTIELALVPTAFAVSDEQIVGWVQRAADAVVPFYGALPLPRVALFVVPVEGDGVVYGKTLGNGGASILVGLGPTVREAQLRQDWVLPHELIHLAFPSVLSSQSWIEEGLSTYLEPVARARAGQLPDEQLWRDFVHSMPQGQPEPDDRGLDETPTWGRTYWGGAIFCLLADVQIREATRGRSSLREALQAIVQEGGNVAHRWPLARALAIGDRATGTDVLARLYAQHAHRAVPVDLSALWSSLGVVPRGDRVVFNDQAPRAAIRQAITARR